MVSYISNLIKKSWKDSNRTLDFCLESLDSKKSNISEIKGILVLAVLILIPCLVNNRRIPPLDEPHLAQNPPIQHLKN